MQKVSRFEYLTHLPTSPNVQSSTTSVTSWSPGDESLRSPPGNESLRSPPGNGSLRSPPGLTSPTLVRKAEINFRSLALQNDTGSLRNRPQSPTTSRVVVNKSPAVDIVRSVPQSPTFRRRTPSPVPLSGSSNLRQVPPSPPTLRRATPSPSRELGPVKAVPQSPTLRRRAASPISFITESGSVKPVPPSPTLRRAFFHTPPSPTPQRAQIRDFTPEPSVKAIPPSPPLRRKHADLPSSPKSPSSPNLSRRAGFYSPSPEGDISSSHTASPPENATNLKNVPQSPTFRRLNKSLESSTESPFHPLPISSETNDSQVTSAKQIVPKAEKEVFVFPASSIDNSYLTECSTSNADVTKCSAVWLNSPSITQVSADKQLVDRSVNLAYRPPSPNFSGARSQPPKSPIPSLNQQKTPPNTPPSPVLPRKFVTFNESSPKPPTSLKVPPPVPVKPKVSPRLRPSKPVENHQQNGEARWSLRDSIQPDLQNHKGEKLFSKDTVVTRVALPGLAHPENGIYGVPINGLNADFENKERIASMASTASSSSFTSVSSMSSNHSSDTVKEEAPPPSHVTLGVRVLPVPESLEFCDASKLPQRFVDYKEVNMCDDNDIKMNGNLYFIEQPSPGDLDLEIDIDNLTGSQQDLRLLHHKQREERKKEQEMAAQERQRLEEILNMCAEYEKQIEKERSSLTRDNRSSTTSDSSTGSCRNSKIKTNGSLTMLASPTSTHKDNSFEFWRRRSSNSSASEDEVGSENGTIKRRPNGNGIETNGSLQSGAINTSTGSTSSDTHIPVFDGKLRSVSENDFVFDDNHSSPKNNVVMATKIKPELHMDHAQVQSLGMQLQLSNKGHQVIGHVSPRSSQSDTRSPRSLNNDVTKSSFGYDNEHGFSKKDTQLTPTSSGIGTSSDQSLNHYLEVSLVWPLLSIHYHLVSEDRGWQIFTKKIPNR